MHRKNPVQGLMMYGFYSAVGGVLSALLLGLLLGTAWLITGSDLVQRLFGLVVIAGPAYVMIVGMGGKTGGKWERFQLTMPLRRSDIAKSQYFLVLIASLLGVPLFLLVLGLHSVLHSGVVAFNVASIVTNVSPLVSMPLVFAGLLFPLACTRLGEEKQEGLSLICLVAGAMYMSLVPSIGQGWGLSYAMTALLTVGISLLIYLISYVVTRNLYGAIDF